jgi:hypothetical protein
MAAEPAIALRKRVIAACVEIMGCPAEYCEHVIGPIEIVPCGWTIRLFNGNPTDNMVARQVVDLISRVWECIPDLRESPYAISTLAFPSGTTVASTDCENLRALAQF